MAIARVKERVHQGGHDVPETAVRRRFTVGLRNFQAVYRNIVDDWLYYDNSGDQPVLLDWGEKP
jgi:predicted ABC-type ATPase